MAIYLKKIKIFQLIVFIERKTNKKCIVRGATFSEKSLLASYKASEIVAKRIKSHTIAEGVIIPACKKIVKSMLGDNAEKKSS